MCGIAGVVWPTIPDGAHVHAVMQSAIAAMHHRGPDSTGSATWAPRDGGTLTALGATRLAVLDLTSAAGQPMSTRDGRYTLIYNGEITNFVELRAELQSSGIAFESAGDTELVLQAWAAWQEGCLIRFEGMYAFAILDRAVGRLSVCRDPFGIKPLFYHRFNKGGLAFGSEIACLIPLMGTAPVLDWHSALDYLATGEYDCSESTFVDGVKHLAPGSRLVVDLAHGDVRVAETLWRPSITTDESVSYPAAVDGVRTLFLESVQRNLRADVPVGLALSGGVDSSAIVCAARKLDPAYPISTFTFVSSRQEENESAWAALVAEKVGARSVSVEPGVSDLADDLDDLILAQGEPFGSPSNYAGYRLFRLMHEQGIVVSLDGQGADELFGGYVGYVGQRTRSLLETRRFVESAKFLRNWRDWPGRSLRTQAGHLAAEFAPRWSLDAAIRHTRHRRLPGLNHAVLADRQLRWQWPRFRENEATMVASARGLRMKAELRDSLTHRGLQPLLRHGDRNSMRFSVESRVPFLDRALVDFVLSLPEHFLVDGRGRTKAVLRDAMVGIVPEAIVNRRDKIGFAAPRDAWVDHQRPAFADLIASAPDIGFIDKGALLPAIDVSRSAYGSGPVKLGSGLTWRALNLYRWADLMGVNCVD